ncbi:MAG TPA: lipoate--protein ligase [Bacteroidales bacterium]|jgi:lipoate-protein ligase A|nr:lipoate--protein ligase [Bacteroidales bacterium]
MYCLNLKSADPYFNLAVDEYLLKHRDEDFVVISVNNNSVVTGKHQVAHREINTRFAFENSIPLIRRISGGGTVYHDAGNLNFSFILNSTVGKQIDFRKYTLPVIAFLNSLGIKAQLEGRNDLKVDGLKISGNAEHVFRNRVLHHGTLLFRADLSVLGRILRKDTSAYATRAVSSNPSPVGNLGSMIQRAGIDGIDDFRKEMIQWFFNNLSGMQEFDLTETESKTIGSLALSRYMTWEWNYAYGPEYQFVNKFTAFGKESFCLLKVKDGIITECKAGGSDIFIKIAGKLPGCRHMPEDLLSVFREESPDMTEIDVFDFF